MRANAIRLEQVLLNLLSNAVDAVEDELMPSVSVDIQQSEEGIRISVTDNGSGIPQSALPHIFDPFFTRKEVGKGLGLGLSIAFNIIKDFGGFIHVHSEPDKGTRFDVQLLQEISS
ncbi:sensor histidine kinase [Veronia nyctiphanis]|nr:ATP-binding protein [Veronia nyctiphanis]